MSGRTTAKRPVPRILILGLLIVIFHSTFGWADASGDKDLCFNRPYPGLVALDACKRLLKLGELTPDERARALVVRGEAYDPRTEIARALADFDEAIQISPNLASAYVGRAGVYTKQKEHEKAVADLTMAINLSPDQAHFHLLRGLGYVCLNRIDDARRDLDLFKPDPTHPWSQLIPRLRQALTQQGALLADWQRGCNS